MKFAVGYQEPPGELFSDIVADYRDAIGEVYFAWCGASSGRPGTPLNDWGESRRLEEELRRIRRMGIKLDLLFNANCYGDGALSEQLARETLGVLEYLESLELLPEIVTTTSLFLAGIIREGFPELELRASVNMRLDSTTALEFLGDRFDSFYIRRDLQRDIECVKLFRGWCDAHGKKLGLLANSGCLRNCPAQTFHDNLVAHSREIFARKSPPGGRAEPTLCFGYYRDEAHRPDFLKATWIRPEDLHHYDGLVDVVKLATRQHDRARTVIGAYTSERFDGDLASLMEPNFSALFASGGRVDNRRFPADWFGTAAACGSFCRHCGHCEEIWRAVWVPNR